MRDDEATHRMELAEFQRREAPKPEAVQILERWQRHPGLEAQATRLLELWDVVERAEVAALEAEVEVLGRAALMPWPPDTDKDDKHERPGEGA